MEKLQISICEYIESQKIIQSKILLNSQKYCEG